MHKKKVILAVTTDINFDQRVQRIAKSLSEDNWDVWVVGRELPSSPPLIAAKYNQYRLKCFFNKGKLFYAEFNIRLFIYLLFKKYNTVTANDLDTVLGVFFSSFFKKCRMIFDAHEYFTEVPELQNRPSTRKVWVYIEKTFVPRFHKHYTVNNSLAEIFKKQLKVDFSVVRNLPYLQENNPDEQEIPYILYQGAVNKGRGLEPLIEAMCEIENLQLKIAGYGDILLNIKQKVDLLKLEHKVIFLGKIPPKQLPELTQNAFIGINLLENTSLNYYYSLANKFFDYVQAEIPQIGMKFPEYELLNREFEVSILLDSTDKNEIVKAIKLLQSDKNLCQKLKNNTKTARLKWNWQQEEVILKEMYQF